jgi:DUF2924 family protein
MAAAFRARGIVWDIQKEARAECAVIQSQWNPHLSDCAMTVAKPKKSRQHVAAGSITIADALSALPAAQMKALRVLWRAHLESEPPQIHSTSLFRRLLAFELQSKAFGGIGSASERKLREISAALERKGDYEPQLRRDFRPGVVLTREWKGVFHKVTVTKNGFQHLGKEHRSLSEIARLITGTRWSGPRFFGLEQKTKAT